MMDIENLAHYQPNWHLLFHVNNYTHSMILISLDHQPIHNTITLYIIPKNSHILYIYHASNKIPITTVIHTTYYPVRKHKRKRHSRMTITLPTSNYNITLLTITTLLQQHTQLINETQLVLTVPNPRDVPWCILHIPHSTNTIIHRILTTLCLKPCTLYVPPIPMM